MFTLYHVYSIDIAGSDVASSSCNVRDPESARSLQINDECYGNAGLPLTMTCNIESL